MQLGIHKSNDHANRNAILALLLALTAGSGQIAFAQNASTASGYNTPGAMGADQESLLPPEVVPLDPSAANTASATQAASNSTQAGSTGAVPGLVDNQVISAKDFRQSAMSSLYSQGQMPMPQSQLGGVSYQNGQSSPMNAPMNSSTNSPFSSPYSNPQMANSAPAQSQTLMGPSSNPPRTQDIRRGGFSNNVSGVASLGTGAALGFYALRPTNLLMGLGMWSLMTTDSAPATDSGYNS